MASTATVDDLQPGDHACLTFSDADERLDIVSAFIRDGLGCGDKVVCLTDEMTPVELTDELAQRGLPVAEAVAAGQLEIQLSAAAYISTGRFEPAAVLDALRTRIGCALQAGYPGIRITADMRWALRPAGGVEQLVIYEGEFTKLLAGARAMTVCQYDREGFDAITLAGMTGAHNRAVAAVTYHNDAVLRICRQHVPPGLRVAGELDYRGLDALLRALSEALRLDHHVFVNMSQLRFIDVAAAGAVVQAALGMAPEQRMTVVCQSNVGKVLRALGADQLPFMQLVVRDVG